MEPLTVISSGITIAVVSGAIGRSLGNRGKVGDKTCTERREACVRLLEEKIDRLGEKIDHLTDFVKNGEKVS